ncbi:MAG: peptidoglycan-binding domain-containing protein [Salinibacterium amurskyense]
MTDSSTELSLYEKPRRRVVPALALGFVVLLVGAGVGWAASTVLTPAKDVLDSTAFTFVEVVDGEVGSSINLNTVAEWTPVPVGSNQASGTVTSVAIAAGDEAKQGSILYTVNLRPVVVAQGSIPAFRSLELWTEGADVKQLQAMLSDLGFYEWTPDGEFDYATYWAVRAWQESLGLERDGVVQSGDLVFVPSLPSRLALDTDVVKRGASLGGGEAVVKGLLPSPTFEIPVTESQSSLMPNGTRVEITNGDAVWDAVVVDRETSESGETTIILAGPDDSVICGDECSTIPVTGQTLLSSRIVTVETVSGLVVPSAALLSGADGIISVIDSEAVAHDVTVVTSARGMSVIEGVPAGTRVRVPASGE